MEMFISIIVLIVAPFGVLLLLEHDVASQAERMFSLELRRRR